MLFKRKFTSPGNSLEMSDKHRQYQSPDVPNEMCTSCPKCKKVLFTSELMEQGNVCAECGYHFKLNSRQRLDVLVDPGTFVEHDADLESTNLLGFPEYEKKIHHAQLASAEKDAVVTGVADIAGAHTALFIMEPFFMMGSMGTVVGEKITRLFEYATENGLPVIGYCVSGGARMQEGILSLMQMAKISGAVCKHSSAGLLYVAVLTDPTTGGVTASFAMEGDIIIAEPDALIGFAGPRVIEQTIRQKLPSGFQRAEFLLERGFLDDVVPRADHRDYLSRLIGLHTSDSDPTEGSVA